MLNVGWFTFMLNTIMLGIECRIFYHYAGPHYAGLIVLSAECRIFIVMLRAFIYVGNLLTF